MEFKFQAMVWASGAKIGAQTEDLKTDFKEELLKKTHYQYIVGLLKIVDGSTFWTSEILRGDKIWVLIIKDIPKLQNKEIIFRV